jgi:hypothetical protein
MSTANEHAGQAALSICEALLLAMNDRGLLATPQRRMRMQSARNSKWNITWPW